MPTKILLPETAHKIRICNVYSFECYDSAGRLKWRDEIKNLVTNEGLDDWLTQYLKGAGLHRRLQRRLDRQRGFYGDRRRRYLRVDRWHQRLGGTYRLR